MHRAVVHIRHDPTALTNSVGACRGRMLLEASSYDMEPTFAAHLQW